MNIAKLILAFWGVFYNSTALSSEVKIDHITQIVNSLEQTILEYEALGFSVKKGRIHSNGLVNAFIQFKDGSEIEFMSLHGLPKDEIAKNYKRLLHDFGEISTSIALSSKDLISIQEKLSKLKIESNIIKGRYWEYLVFPNSPSLEHFFLINIYQKPDDEIELYTHINKAEGIQAVWVDATKEAYTLLLSLGGVECLAPKNIVTLSGTSFVFVESSGNKRNQVIGVSLNGVKKNILPNDNLFKKDPIYCKKHITNKVSRTPQAAPLL